MKSLFSERKALGHPCRVIFQLLPCILLLAGSIAVRAQSDAVSTQFIRATQAMQEGNLDAAAAGFAAIVKQSPNFAEAHFNLGLVSEERGKYDEAIGSFQKALSLK